MKQIQDQTFTELLDYLARRPYHEVFRLITKLVGEGRQAKQEISTPAPRDEGGK